MAKPALFADSRSPADRFDPNKTRGNDPSYVPGYSEIVQANDIDASDDVTFLTAHKDAKEGSRKKEDWYKKIGAHPQKLPVELSWQRTSGINGERSYTADKQMADAQDEGWSTITRQELEDLGYGMPPSAHVDADGLIRRRDTALCVRDGEVARRWHRYRQEQAALAEGSPLPKELDADGIRAETFFEKETIKPS